MNGEGCYIYVGTDMLSRFVFFPDLISLPLLALASVSLQAYFIFYFTFIYLSLAGSSLRIEQTLSPQSAVKRRVFIQFSIQL